VTLTLTPWIDGVSPDVRSPAQPVNGNGHHRPPQSLLPTGEALASAELTPLAPVSTYHWFSDENYQRARRWFDAAQTVARSRNLALPEHAAALQSVKWLIDATLDLYSWDRAQNAACVIPEHPTPQRLSDIPQKILVTSAQYRSTEYTLCFRQLEWTQDTPWAATDCLTTLLLHVEPDLWLLGRYEYMMPRQLPTIVDPIIYARYGNNWYIKVVEWP
jgi:hypothetical protein